MNHVIPSVLVILMVGYNIKYNDYFKHWAHVTSGDCLNTSKINFSDFVHHP